MARHPLRFGMAAYAWRFDGQAPPGITSYSVDAEHEYPVKVAKQTEGDPWATSHEVGKAHAGGAAGDFWVDYDTTERTPRFYSVWRVTDDGVARLTEVLMATGPYTAS